MSVSIIRIVKAVTLVSKRYVRHEALIVRPADGSRITICWNCRTLRPWHLKTTNLSQRFRSAIAQKKSFNRHETCCFLHSAREISTWGVVAHSISSGLLIITITIAVTIATVTISVVTISVTATSGPQSTCSRDVCLQPSNLFYFIFVVHIDFI